MRPVPVVVVYPPLELGGSIVGVVVGGCVRPFAQCGLDESFGLAVGLRAIGASEFMRDA
jgi:hypothetical protein